MPNKPPSSNTSPDSSPDVKVIDRRWWAREADRKEGSEEPSLKPSYVEQLEQQLLQKDKVLQGSIEHYKNAEKEFEAARLRQRRDVAKEIERGKQAILAEFLDIIDGLDRALTVREPANTDALLQGVALVRDSFLAKLDRLGITRISAQGQRFDPTRHEAVSMLPTPDPAQDGSIVAVVAEGYQSGDDVLRPARVVVASYRNNEAQAVDVKAEG